MTEKMGLTGVSIQLDGLAQWGVILVPKMEHFLLAALKLTEKKSNPFLRTEARRK